MREERYSKVDSTAAIALVLARSMQNRTEDFPYVKDISGLLFRLREKGFRVRDLGLRRIPDGYYSEDVETFVGQLLSMGYASQRSPIKLKVKGVTFCEEMVKEEAGKNKEEVEKLERAIQQELSTVATSA